MVRAAERRPSGRGGRSQDAVRVQEELCHPRAQLKAFLLLLLKRGPSHGYELFQEVKPLGYEGQDAALVYRALHWLQDRGLVEPRWDTSRRGPARRVFEVTPAGQEMTSACAASLGKQFRIFFTQDLVGQQGRSSEPPPSFEVLIEAKLAVRAADSDSAGIAVKMAFGTGQVIGPQVRSTGEVCVHDARELEECLSQPNADDPAMQPASKPRARIDP